MKTLTQKHSPDMDRSHPDIERSRDVPTPHPYNLQQALERFERGYIANILELTRWNLRKTAQMLGISPDTLAAKMRDYDLLTDVTQQVRTVDGKLPSWEGLGVGCGQEDAAQDDTHPLPLPGGELSATLRHISY